MTTRVYRVQDSSGRGPFRPGFSIQWSDRDWQPGRELLPTWMQEFGPDLVRRNLRPGEHYGTAVRSHFDIHRWFSPTELGRLIDFGYSLVAIDVDRILGESRNQLVFARRRPLFEGVIIIPVINMEHA